MILICLFMALFDLINHKSSMNFKNLDSIFNLNFTSAIINLDLDLLILQVNFQIWTSIHFTIFIDHPFLSNLNFLYCSILSFHLSMHRIIDFIFPFYFYVSTISLRKARLICSFLWAAINIKCFLMLSDDVPLFL